MALLNPSQSNRVPTEVFRYNSASRYVLTGAMAAAVITLISIGAYLFIAGKALPGEIVGIFFLSGFPMLLIIGIQVSWYWVVLETSESGVAQLRGERLVRFIAFRDVKAIDASPWVQGIGVHHIVSKDGTTIRFDDRLVNYDTFLAVLKKNVSNFDTVYEKRYGDMPGRLN